LLLIIAAAVVVAAAVIFSITSLGNKIASDADKTEDCCWAEGATPAWVSDATGLRIPAEASDVRVSYYSGSRYGTAFMSFTLPDKKADSYLAQLTPAGSEMIANINPRPKDYAPTPGFAHLKLPEPESLTDGMRTIGVCRGDVDTPAGRDVQHCAGLFAHRFEQGHTRIYTRTGIESGLTPPPAAPPS
jgi:hypothetical protein